MKDIQIEHITIGENHTPFIIAEMSGNHNKSLNRALEIVEAAAKSGAHAIKLQTYTPETITIDASGGLFEINNSDSLWKGKQLFSLYKDAYTPWEWHETIFKRARELGMVVFSTPFDDTAVDFLENLGVGAYKVASFENNHYPLLAKIASTKKPVIMSTGLSTLTTLDRAVTHLRNHGCEDLILLKCTSTYPAKADDSNVRTIPHMSDLFQCHVGLSDHTMGIGVPIASIAIGARVIEKHFTLNRADGGVDSTFSMEPAEMESLVVESNRAFRALGKIQYGIMKSEEGSLRFKRSIYVVKDIKKGEVLTEENIRIIRPGDGLDPYEFDNILGATTKRDVYAGTPFTFDLVL